MTLRTQLLSFGIASCAVAACARRPGNAPATLTPPTAGAPARFLPTREDSTQGYPHQGFIWSVTWDVGERRGTIPRGVEVRGGLPTVAPEHDSLAAILAHARSSHEVFCLACGTPPRSSSPNRR